MNDWRKFKGVRKPHDAINTLPAPPEWRGFAGIPIEGRSIPPVPEIDPASGRRARGPTFEASPEAIDLVNAALYLRRPLLVTGKPGTGKSSLAYAVAYELQLGRVLVWPINTRTTLVDGLYRYDAIGRLQQAQLDRTSAPDIGDFLRLGPVGTALLPSALPRVLLLDEIDKSDIDLPNDLLNIFEEGEFDIPELQRLAKKRSRIPVLTDDGDQVEIENGLVRCAAFPLVILTSNGEREFPPAFLRRCLRLDIKPPKRPELLKIVEYQLGKEVLTYSEQLVGKLVDEFLRRRDNQQRELSTDQLLNAIYLVAAGIDPLGRDQATLIDAVMRQLTNEEPT